MNDLLLNPYKVIFKFYLTLPSLAKANFFTVVFETFSAKLFMVSCGPSYLCFREER